MGEVEITEVFEIEMNKINLKTKVDVFKLNGIVRPIKGILDKDCKELVKKGRFKSVEKMFQYFDKKYNLSTPKRFVVYRWRWL